ncbi:MAG: hypothetical protein AAFO68_05270, partial [Pseudomonadota bacterium]
MAIRRRHNDADCTDVPLLVSRPEKRDQKYQTGEQKKHAADHRPKTANARDDEPDSRQDEKYPANEIDLPIADATVFFIRSLQSHTHVCLIVPFSRFGAPKPPKKKY